ncbi:bacterio-opsin activator domain-containing protein [Salarchaeum japonicum]|uniref:bacterio-opsin activator domain-containing protein n=1 Tax=Salarchaeum japonicum TaxID=555573 RepID=UPI003C76E7DC
MNERLQHAPIGAIEVSDDTIVSVNDTAQDLLDIDRSAVGAAVADVLPRSVEDSLIDAFADAPITDTEFEEYYPALDRWLAVSIVPVDDATIVYLQDVTPRHRHAETVDRLQAERDRTGVVDGVRSAVLADLVAASSRAEIADTICHGLGETDLYEFAWVGERTVDSNRLVVQAAAGTTGETFTAVQETLESDAQTPEERAVESGHLQAMQPLAEADSLPDAIRMAGFADGVQSALAIPLVSGSDVHGVVGVYAAGTDAFSARERRSFKTLGEIAGFAITATRNQNLLLSDAVTEVTFAVEDTSVLATLSDDLDATVTLTGVVPQNHDTMLCFVEITGGTEHALDQAVTTTAGVADARLISETASGGTVELELHDSSPLSTVVSRGGSIRQATFDDGSGRIVANFPQDSDIHRITTAIGDGTGVEVVAKRERNRSVTTARELRDNLETELTDRQRTVLRTAYLADYFESPRGSTAEEVAASLDITGSTLLHHLRASQRKLLDVFFAEDTTVTD